MLFFNSSIVSERKVLSFTGFHSNAGKTFTGLASSVLKVLLRKVIVLTIHQENFHSLLKINESHKIFNFCRLRYIYEGLLAGRAQSELLNTIFDRSIKVYHYKPHEGIEAE